MQRKQEQKQQKQQKAKSNVMKVRLSLEVGGKEFSLKFPLRGMKAMGVFLDNVSDTLDATCAVEDLSEDISSGIQKASEGLETMRQIAIETNLGLPKDEKMMAITEEEKGSTPEESLPEQQPARNEADASNSFNGLVLSGGAKSVDAQADTACKAPDSTADSSSTPKTCIPASRREADSADNSGKDTEAPPAKKSSVWKKWLPRPSFRMSATSPKGRAFCSIHPEPVADN
eukprot:gb/GFBE01017439.1/.p1 GENE.gb/GFBE01017439.1/~~gb/GFBE01017439.1/.p1  ORF type:complete len:230 (+),score=65.67 gb/GFBE01017439.1/:1-690(+)